jgi:small GTP-binding protein
MNYKHTENRIKLYQESFLTNNYSFERVIYRFKLIMVGNVAVGKSAILSQFLDKKFTDQYNCTINVDIRIQTVVIDDNNIVDLQIWDTCGQETYKNLTKQYYNNSHGCFLIFDLTSRSSFEDLADWIEDIRAFASKDIIIILVGNKSDLEEERAVSFEEASNFAKKYFIDYIETSAKTGVNIRLLFDVLCLSLIKKSEEQDTSIQSFTKKKITLSDSSNDVRSSQGTFNYSKSSNEKDRKTKCCS